MPRASPHSFYLSPAYKGEPRVICDTPPSPPTPPLPPPSPPPSLPPLPPQPLLASYYEVDYTPVAAAGRGSDHGGAGVSHGERVEDTHWLDEALRAEQPTASTDEEEEGVVDDDGRRRSWRDAKDVEDDTEEEAEAHAEWMREEG